MKKITAYTDGSAVLKYPYKGGSGAYIITGKNKIKIRKGWCNTKTGRCELHAAIMCMKAVKNKSSLLIIYSDSMYIVNTCNKWIDNWEKSSFEGKKNIDLLRQLLFEIRSFKRRPILKHIKGHQDIIDEHTFGNNIADELANYKTQKSWEVDVPFTDLTKIEEQDFKIINNKQYWNGSY